jgi:uncharacterized protein
VWYVTTQQVPDNDSEKGERSIMNDSLIGILSDTHDNQSSIRSAVDEFNRAGCSLVVHAGDYVAPFTAREFGHLTCPFIGVFGNNDGEKAGLRKQFESFGVLYGAPHEFTHAGRRLVVMHEPYFLDEYQTRPDIDVIIYGHTHQVDIRQGPPMVINPGECCRWLTGHSTIVFLDLAAMEVRSVELGTVDNG